MTLIILKDGHQDDIDFSLFPKTMLWESVEQKEADMPKIRLLETMMIHDAVWFPPIGMDDKGQKVYGPPKAIKVRWEERQQEYIATDGGKRMSRAVVYTPTLLPLKAVLWKGKLKDLESVSLPFENTNAWEIEAHSKTDTIKGTQSLCLAFL